MTVRRIGRLHTIFVNGARSNRAFTDPRRAETERAAIATELNDTRSAERLPGTPATRKA